MARALTIVVAVVVATLFGWAVPLGKLFDAFQPMITALAIMVAAVFVRLNRGMPTLEWRSVDPEQRRELTSRIVELSKEYGWIIAINAATLVGLVAVSVVGKTEVTTCWPEWVQRMVSGAIGGFVALCVARMAYVVWRDVDVVKLQKRLIDGTAARESIEEQTKLADEKVANIRFGGLRRVEVPPPKAWGE
jgi:hypothetical protein